MSQILTNPKRLSRVFRSDATNVSRDPTLIFAITMSLIPTFIFTVWREPINTAMFENFGVENIIRWISPTILVLPAFLIGWVCGFLFLEDRDDATLLAIDITPVGKTGFISYRAAVTALIAFAITMVNCRLFVPEKSLALMLAISLMVAMSAVISAMILPVVARNKVEGLAITKVTNIGSIVPLVALFVTPWRYLAGIVPTYWIGEALNLSPQSYIPVWVAVIIGILMHIGALILLNHLLAKRVG